jgi:hypothetical protein
MKPCRNIKMIEKLIEKHSDKVVIHSIQAQFHQHRIAVLHEYIHELNKPGFRISGSYIVAGTTKRSEPVVTTAGDTFSG